MWARCKNFQEFWNWNEWIMNFVSWVIKWNKMNKRTWNGKSTCWPSGTVVNMRLIKPNASFQPRKPNILIGCYGMEQYSTNMLTWTVKFSGNKLGFQQLQCSFIFFINRSKKFRPETAIKPTIVINKQHTA